MIFFLNLALQSGINDVVISESMFWTDDLFSISNEDLANVLLSEKKSHTLHYMVPVHNNTKANSEI